ncbi:DEAD/DEAH box helicase family protein [Geobacter sulfurreducens subsp. ethanolicus]|uniref:restriction endonuclease n=1 Tax=Geobacter sulfurreducens TaxID=35554 RepID=UPI002573CE94|nr:DEAD/DEAH box helicase family protein [Geobacter sulfurreducens]BEH08882.1 DEAD/DEAH box helicase family protein [Geobacter sulfurreducens subsp. ethanolicus]
MAKLHLQFDPNQRYQLDAISSIVELFQGTPRREGEFVLGDEIQPNFPEEENIDEFLLLDNLQAIQQLNNGENKGSELNVSESLNVDDGLVLEGTGNDSIRVPHFTIEMETGTGKTYVYFRTIYELFQKYGFTKFIIVVPSIAIYQGVIKTFEITKSHFSTIYSNIPVAFVEYDGNQIGRIRDFATNYFPTIMVMTRDAFNKTSNNFYKSSEKLPGELKPYQWVQGTRPIVILDEPQNINTEKANEAIRTLKPLFVLRYSATHRVTPNLSYRLTPVDAFRQKLVKQIEVIGISQLGDLNVPLLRLISVSRNPIAAKLKVYSLRDGQTSEQEVTVKQGDDLFKKTHREEYHGLIVNEIKIGKEGEDDYVEFANGLKVSFSDEVVGSKADVFRAQIEKTIETHIIRQAELLPLGIKVISLFFIDRVANYTAQDGLIKRLFDESFNKLKGKLTAFAKFEPHEVRKGYFAKPKPDSKDEEAVDTDGSNQKQREMEKAAFELIMRNKEQLLSFDEPVSFVFAHSALKEGWDNPNVFQICTLNQTNSSMKKRQEIGRGLRLCVDQTGARCPDYDVNVLTVVANESYESYVSNLQREYTEDGDEAPAAPKKAEDAISKRNNKIFTSKEFREFWQKLNQQMNYTIAIDTDCLISECVKRLDKTNFPEPVIVVSRGNFIIKEYSIKLLEATDLKAKIQITFKDTAGNNSKQELFFQKDSDLYKILRDDNLRGFKIMNIGKVGSEYRVKFTNEVEITTTQPHHFKTERAKASEPAKRETSEHTYPVFDVVNRVASETNLTRQTIATIFSRLSEGQKSKIFKNPEGWCGVFLAQIKGALCDHIAENIIFNVDPSAANYDADDLFPETRRSPQRELVPAGKRGLYDKVQIDSDVERYFVKNSVQEDEEHVILYFKFPPKFKILLPKIIGNYNPDWGIVRKSDDGNLTLQLVRETKGGLKLEELQFPQEKRKINCAMKHFKELGIGYRVVTHQTPSWWLEEGKGTIFSP